MARTEVKVVGGPDILKALQELESVATRKSVARNALMAAAKPLHQAMLDNVPVDEGRLRDAIVIVTKQPRRRRVKTRYSIAIWIKKARAYRKLKSPKRKRDYAIGTTPEFYGAILEFGKRRVPPRPWMRPAWQAEGDGVALERVQKQVWIALSAAAKRQAKRLAKRAGA